MSNSVIFNLKVEQRGYSAHLLVFAIGMMLINIAFALFPCAPLTQQLTGFSAPESGKAYRQHRERRFT